MKYQGHVEKGMVVMDQPLPLPDGTAVRVEPLVPAFSSFWQSRTLEELAREQGVNTPESFDELVGGWPPEELDDDFEQAMRSWRQRELAQLPC